MRLSGRKGRDNGTNPGRISGPSHSQVHPSTYLHTSALCTIPWPGSGVFTRGELRLSPEAGGDQQADSCAGCVGSAQSTLLLGKGFSYLFKSGRIYLRQAAQLILWSKGLQLELLFCLSQEVLHVRFALRGWETWSRSSENEEEGWSPIVVVSSDEEFFFFIW